MTGWGRGTLVTYQTFENTTITQPVHKVSHRGNNDQKQLPFYLLQCASKHPKPSCLGSHTDVLALGLHTALYLPPRHNKHKCLKSPKWKLGLFFFFFKQVSFKATTGALKAPRVLCSMN